MVSITLTVSRCQDYDSTLLPLDLIFPPCDGGGGGGGGGAGGEGGKK